MKLNMIPREREAAVGKAALARLWGGSDGLCGRMGTIWWVLRTRDALLCSQLVKEQRYLAVQGLPGTRAEITDNGRHCYPTSYSLGPPGLRGWTGHVAKDAASTSVRGSASPTHAHTGNPSASVSSTYLICIIPRPIHLSIKADLACDADSLITNEAFYQLL